VREVVDAEMDLLYDAQRKQMEEARGQNEAGGTLAQMVQIWQAKPTQKALVLGCFLMALNQFTGINTVMYYAASIYNMAGYSNEISIWLSGYTALAQFAGVMIGLFLVDRVGRKPLLLTSLGMVTLSLGLLGFSFVSMANNSPVVNFAPDPQCASDHNWLWGNVATKNCAKCLDIAGCGFCGSPDGAGYCVPIGEDGRPTGECSTFQSLDNYGVDFDPWTTDTCAVEGGGTLSVVAMVLYLLSFGIGMSGLPWTLTSEIYPQKTRALMTAVSTGVNWAGNVLVSASFLSIASPAVLGPNGAFWLYALIGLNGFLWLSFNLPETKGLTLEQIESLFSKQSTTSQNDAPKSYKAIAA